MHRKALYQPGSQQETKTHSEGGTEVWLKLDNGYAGVYYARLLYLPMFEIVVKYIKTREEWKRETSERDLQRGRQGLKEDKGR